MLFLSCPTISSQRILLVAKGFLLLVTSHACHGQVDGPAEREIAAQLNRASVEILKSDMGDLTGDGFLEYAAAVDTDIILDGQKERMVVIFRWNEDRWLLWTSSSSSVLGSEEGGVLGDPFQDLGIQDQKLWIAHSGGSNWRWTMEDAYRREGEDLVLSEHRSSWGSFCEVLERWEIDLTEAFATCDIEREECPEGFGDNSHLDSIPMTETWAIPKGLRITIEHRNDSIVRFVSPIHGFETTL